MSTGKSPKILIIFVALIVLTAILCIGCTRIKDLTEDKAYLTPIPKTTLEAFQFGQPVKTKLQAVIATHGMQMLHTNWVGQPMVIFADNMEYKEALHRIDPLNSTDYYDPTPSDTPVWLVVFKGEYTITEPLGTETPLYSGCGFALINAKDGNEMRAGTNFCERLDLAP
jgi:hypothetical protein